MDQAERNKLRTLANDAIIDLFGSEGRELKLAQALEQCVDELEYIAEECETCKFCDDHGDVEDDSLDVDVNELLRIHRELKKSAGKLQEVYGTEDTEQLESLVDELETELVIP